MTPPTFELQSAVITRLRADVVVTGFVAQRVYDLAPMRPDGTVTAAVPYISMGPSDELSDDADCIDGFEITFQIDIYSVERGYHEVRKIADAVRRALKLDLVLSANALVLLDHRITRYMREPDNITSHAAMTFTAIVEQP